MLEHTIIILCMILRQTCKQARQDIPLLPGLLACATTQNFLSNEREHAEANRKREAFQDICGYVVLEGFFLSRLEGFMGETFAESAIRISFLSALEQQ